MENRSLTNKTAVIRKPGKLQFDFMGDDINADIAMKIPVDSGTVANYSNISTLIQGQKIKSGLLPSVFVGISDIGQGWQQTGELIHKTDRYSSIFIYPSAGTKMTRGYEIRINPGCCQWVYSNENREFRGKSGIHNGW